MDVSHQVPQDLDQEGQVFQQLIKDIIKVNHESYLSYFYIIETVFHYKFKFRTLTLSRITAAEEQEQGRTL